ncbi:glycosyl transferase family 1, partial [Acidobacteriota bacterium]
MKKPRVAFFSPFQPVPSGISEYSEDLLPELSRHLDLDLFVEREGIGSHLKERYKIFKAEDYPSMAESYDMPLYQMGNNVHHLYIYPFIKNFPGIVVLHDTVLHHFYIEATLARDDPDSYVQLMEACYGE